MNQAGTRSQHWFRCRRALWLLLVPILLGVSRPTEYDVKLAYLYNFTKFVSWPESAFSTADSPINICVFGNISDTETTSFLNERKSRNRPISLKLLSKLPAQELCHIIFFTKDIDNAKVRSIIRALNTPTLLVGETSGFAEKDGIIEFITDDRHRVRIEVNLANAKQHKLSIRAQLLEIARKIYRDEENS